MISYIDPKIELIPNPEGIDKAIEKLQRRMDTLGWIEKVFGRAKIQRQKREGQRDILYPEVYNERQAMTLMPNDNLESFCFFLPVDPLMVGDYSIGDNEVPASQRVDIYFWGNLAKIDQSREHDFTEELRKDALQKLTWERSYKVDRSYTSMDTVFAPFTITDTFQPFLKPEYAAFRISGILTFNYSVC